MQTTTRFWEFNQNNTGGKFHEDAKRGIAHYVIVEAKTVDEASARAQDIGIYYDGCRDGRDCSCCGDRWHEPWGDGNELPSIYGREVKPGQPRGQHDTHWMDGAEGYIHFLDGRIEAFMVDA